MCDDVKCGNANGEPREVMGGAACEEACDGANDAAREDACDMTLAAKVAYNGAPFCGFARQPGMLTVQGELEHALSLLFRREVLITCAGRTDAGVHAKGQVISFDISRDELRSRSLHNILRSMGALTHDDISVLTLREARIGFSARFDAKSREYRYFVSPGGFTSLYMRDFSWNIPYTLNLEVMRAGAAHLIGEHDFISFCKAQSAVGKPTHRCVQEISIERVNVLGEDLIQIKVIGNAFLHSMVRTIVGTLVSVGRGARKPEWVRDVLRSKNRCAAGECAPAHGLTFWKVNY